MVISMQTSRFSDPTQRVFFLCGETHDEFWPADLKQLDLQRVLHRHLVTLGYKRIVYINSLQRIYFWDNRSYILSRPRGEGQEQESSCGSSVASRIPPGPLGRGPMLLRRNTSRSPAGQNSGPCDNGDNPSDPMSTSLLSTPRCHGMTDDSGIAALLISLMRETDPERGPTVIIFADGLAFLTHYGQTNPSALQALAGAVEQWFDFPAANRNICCFVFQNQILTGLDDFIGSYRSWAKLRSFLFRSEGNTTEPSGRVINITSPHRDEIASIVHYHRLRQRVPVEWDTLPETLDRLARHWRSRQLSAKELSGKIYTLCKTHRSLNSAALGSLIEQNPKGTALDRLRSMRGMEVVSARVGQWLDEYSEKKSERFELRNPSEETPLPDGSSTGRLLKQPDSNLGMNLHLVLTGRPGTGKTTVARLIAEVFAENGILPSGHLVEVQRRDLVAGFVGQTAIKTMEVIESAMGGMLFIDEAYELTQQGENDFAGEAVATLLKAMEDRKGQFSVVAAGYPEPMRAFLETNEGLSRRFADNIIEIPEYNAETLHLIFEDMATDAERNISPELQEALPGFFKNWWRSNHRIREFGFAGDVKDKLLAGFESQRRSRVVGLPQDDPSRREFTLADVPEAYRHYLPGERQDDLKSLLAELNAMEGLDTVKQKIRQIMALQQQRVRETRLDSPPKPGHYVFSGSPGTGKTTVARLMGRMLVSLELLDRSEVVETNSGEILAARDPVAFLRERFEDALGGVLFIDEAYGLAPSTDGDGRQLIIDALTPLLDKHSHEICVVVAGYTAPMSRFLESNRGLSRRFPKGNRLKFNDFTPEQLLRIFRKLACKKGFDVPETLDPALRACFQQRKDEQKDHFGNAGEVQNVFAEMEGNFATRSLNEPDMTRVFIIADVPSQQRRPIDEEDLRNALEKLDRLTGLASVKKAVRRWISRVRVATRRGDETAMAPGSFAFVGNPGTGKTTVARLLGDIMRALGLLDNGEVIEVGRGDLVAGYSGQTAGKTKAVCSQALDNVLFLDEAYSLVQGESDQFGNEALDTLLDFLENNRRRVSLVIAGYPDEIRQFIERNPGMQRRIPNRLVFENYSPEELVEIFTGMAAEKRFELSDASTEKLHLIFERMVKESDRNFGNAGEARNLLDAAIERLCSRLDCLGDLPDSDPRYFLIEPEDLQDIDSGPEREKAYKNVRSRLDSFIGLNSVKKTIDDMLGQFKIRQKQGNRALGELTPGHYAFIGNPGTGKTEVARLFGELLYGIGLLKRGHTVVVSRADLVGDVVGATAIKTNARIDEAMDGVLLIDEAYSLVQSEQDTYGREALDLLIARMENQRRRLCVIMAGYTTDMRQLIEKNEGLRSRITREISFPDYTTEELVRIFTKMAHDQGYELGEGTGARLSSQFNALRRNTTEAFGNARQARILLNEASQRMSIRLLEDFDEIPESDPRLFRIEADDIAEPEPELDIKAALAPLDRLIGLEELKQQIRNWADHMETERWKGDQGEPPAPGHYLFVGNPGTGKTTVARLMGGILKSLGCLPSGHVVEVKRGDLVAGYSGQTAIKTQERLKDAMGGVLFLDEAYSLVQGEQDSFGNEALDTLLTFMEDHRHNICVIFAGYPEPISELIKTNPGLTSRFDETFVFKNYSPDEMVKIFQHMASEKKLTLAPEVPGVLLPIFTSWTAVNDPHFGNAREVRKLFEAARQNISVRVMRETGRKRPDDLSILSLLTEADVPEAQLLEGDSARESEKCPAVARISRRSLPNAYSEEPPATADLPTGASGQQYAIESIQRIAPAVMFIEVQQCDGQRGSGTGFLITPDGLALTCYHVAGNTARMQARFDHLPDQWFEVKLVAADAEADLALVRVIECPGGSVVLADPATTAPLGESVGLLGYLLGDQLGAEITFTRGEINSTRRQGKVRYYQLSAGAGPGNSGGPLFRLSDGQVIGVLHAGIERTANAAINLAVDIREFYDRLTVDETKPPSEEVQSQAQILAGKDTN